MQCEVIDTVHVSSAKSDGSYARWEGFSCDNRDVRKAPFAVADQIQSLSTCILYSVTTNRPLTRDAGVKQGAGTILICGS